MGITVQQKDAVAAWFAAGASLDEIQKRIKSEFGIHMTYLDVRLLVAELPQPEEKAEREGAKTPRTPRAAPAWRASQQIFHWHASQQTVHWRASLYCHVLGVLGVLCVLARPPENEIPCGRPANPQWHSLSRCAK